MDYTRGEQPSPTAEGATPVAPKRDIAPVIAVSNTAAASAAAKPVQ